MNLSRGGDTSILHKRQGEYTLERDNEKQKPIAKSLKADLRTRSPFYKFIKGPTSPLGGFPGSSAGKEYFL